MTARLRGLAAMAATRARRYAARRAQQPCVLVPLWASPRCVRLTERVGKRTADASMRSCEQTWSLQCLYERVGSGRRMRLYAAAGKRGAAYATTGPGLNKKCCKFTAFRTPIKEIL
ncbi:hypothetical protein DQX05_29425 [Paenibacillus thiaminolyticus]|uniref:Uncharacterized protein n=1 Tax=Paenibacillus thiaminolyticus TaxID=49283 RepID=A0A3A3GDQ1_PANTH|nr:hypothetical protein DQX05_29425 [Paenibacillus thiaminolyticus]